MIAFFGGAYLSILLLVGGLAFVLGGGIGDLQRRAALRESRPVIDELELRRDPSAESEGFGAIGFRLGAFRLVERGYDGLRNRFGRGRNVVSMIEESIEMDLPVGTVYNQWTQFEEFPRFMQGVEEVRQLDDRHLHWVAKIAGQRREWDAEITEQHPDERIAWRSTSGAENAGVVTFHRLGDQRTRIMLQLDFEPDDLLEKAGDTLGFTDRRIAGDLERFKNFLEERGTETGAWRGDVPRPE